MEEDLMGPVLPTVWPPGLRAESVGLHVPTPEPSRVAEHNFSLPARMTTVPTPGVPVGPDAAPWKLSVLSAPTAIEPVDIKRLVVDGLFFTRMVVVTNWTEQFRVSSGTKTAWRVRTPPGMIVPAGSKMPRCHACLTTTSAADLGRRALLISTGVHMWETPQNPYARVDWAHPTGGLNLGDGHNGGGAPDCGHPTNAPAERAVPPTSTG